ncbi:MAG: YitT family protein [Oscillospiraceae bacterium]
MKNSGVIKEYFFIAVGTFLAALGVYYFMVPQDIVTGGVSGLAIVIAKFLPLPISLITLIINGLLLIIGFTFLGKEFGMKTVYSSILFSFFIYLMETFYPVTASLTDMVWLDLVMSVIISSFGLSIVFNQNASTGGTDILARIFNKSLNVEIGTGLLLADAFVVGSSIIAFGLKTGLVGALGWFLAGLSINYFIDGFTIKKEVTIMTNKAEEIRNFILGDMSRGLTVYDARGGYTNEEKEIIVTVLDKNEYYTLKKAIKNIDPNVFLIVRTVHEVLGEGFAGF